MVETIINAADEMADDLQSEFKPIIDAIRKNDQSTVLRECRRLEHLLRLFERMTIMAIDEGLDWDYKIKKIDEGDGKPVYEVMYD